MLKSVMMLTASNLRSLVQRPTGVIITQLGIATVVAVLISLLAVSAGLSKNTVDNVPTDIAIVVSEGAASDYIGSIPREAADIVSEAPGVKRDSSGNPLVVPAANIIVDVKRIEDGAPANISLRGIRPTDFGRIRAAPLIRGRMYRAGLRELVVSKSAAAQFRNLNVGDHVTLRGSGWTVVGQYAEASGGAEGGLVGDADTVLSAFDRNTYQSILVKLTSPAAFQKFKDSLASDPRLSVTIKTLKDYLADQFRGITIVIDFVGYFVGTLMGVGAIFNAINSMYASLDGRMREIATLRAMGFPSSDVLISLLVESVIIAIPAALIGAVAAWLLFQGHAARIVSMTFPMAVTPALVGIGVFWAIIIGLLGGLPPALRAARMPIARGLREV